jgi:hypothetical protein
VRRVIKALFWVAFALAIVGTGSYAGARFTAGELVGGPRSPVEGRTSTFSFRGVESVKGNPRAWVFTYSRVGLAGVNRVRIVVSVTGKLLAVQPPDLEARLVAYRRSLEP